MTSVLVVSPEPVGDRMAGPAIRALELARSLSAACDVTLAAAEPSEASGVRLLEAGMEDVEQLLGAARDHDVVVAQELPPVVIERLARGRAKLVADLYNPQVVEVLEGVAGRAAPEQRRLHRRIVARSLAMCAAADLVLCANERQRDLWIGGMALHGLIGPDEYASDPTLRARVMVVPFGLPDGPPPAPIWRAARGVSRDRRQRAGARLGRRSLGVARSGDPDARRLAAQRARRAAHPPRRARSGAACARGLRPGGRCGPRARHGPLRGAAGRPRPCERRLGAIRGARRLAGRRGPRRDRASRPSRGPLRAPHAGARLPVGRSSRGGHARRRAGRGRGPRRTRDHGAARRSGGLRRRVRAAARTGRRRRA